MRPARHGVSCLVAGVLICGGIDSPRGGEAFAPKGRTQQAAPIFKTGVDLIQIDVTVVRKTNREPLRGLNAADFTVRVDDAPRDVVAFYEADEAVPATAAGTKWSRTIPADVISNDPIRATEGRLFVLMIDDALIPGDPWIIKQTRDAAHAIVARIGAADRMALVYSSNSFANQPFTNERSKLDSSIDGFRPGSATYLFGWDKAGPPPGTGLTGTRRPSTNTSGWQPEQMIDDDIQMREASMTTLAGVAEALSSLPEKGKTVIYLGPGIPINPAAASPQLASGGSLATRDATARLFAELTGLFRRMQISNISVYALDPTGLGGIEAFIGRALSGLSGIRAPVDQATGRLIPSVRGATIPIPDDYGHFAAKLDLDFMESLSASTGGRATVNTNDLSAGIDGIFRESGSYYLLGIAKSPGEKPGNLHRLNVSVNRQDVEVRARKWYATPAEPKGRDAGTPSVQEAIGSALPTSGLLLEANAVVLPGATPEASPVVAVTLTLPTSTSEVYELRSVLLTMGGRTVSSHQQVVSVRAEKGAAGRHAILLAVRARPGRYELRLAASRRSDHQLGSVFLDVDVPDFSAGPISLSGVALEAAENQVTRSGNGPPEIAGINPTTRRAFATKDRVNAFARVCQGRSGLSRAATMLTTLVDENDRSYLRADSALTADRFSGDSQCTDYRVDVPLGALSPGAYLLTVSASQGDRTVNRSVVLQIVR